jgi:hypothetical protein
LTICICVCVCVCVYIYIYRVTRKPMGVYWLPSVLTYACRKEVSRADFR